MIVFKGDDFDDRYETHVTFGLFDCSIWPCVLFYVWRQLFEFWEVDPVVFLVFTNVCRLHVNRLTTTSLSIPEFLFKKIKKSDIPFGKKNCHHLGNGAYLLSY